nr:hypothetical protein [Halorhodospira abdelmalekii]
MTAFEHGWLEVGDGGDLSTCEADALAAAAGALPSACLQWGHRRVKFTQFCGVVQVAGLQIEVLPKLTPYQTEQQQRQTLLTLLARSGELEGLDHGSAGLATQEGTLLDLFIRHFGRLLRDQLRQGLLRDYRDVDDSLDQVRGRIDLVRQQRENLMKPQRLACRYGELVTDIPVNRLLHSALLLVIRLSSSLSLSHQLRALRTHFSQAGTLSRHEHAPRCDQLNRMQRRYAPLIELAHLFLEGQYLDARSGHYKAFSLLFDMNRLFERFTANRLRPFARRCGFHLVEQGPRRYLGEAEDGRGRLLMRPDLCLLDTDKRPVAILDTKWKRIDNPDALAALSSADLYQLATYASAYHCDRVGLLYPEQTYIRAGQRHTLNLIRPGSGSALLTLEGVPVDTLQPDLTPVLGGHHIS